MSISLMSAVWQLDLDASHKIVLLALADAANDEGFCWPGMASLCRKASKSERTVQGAIQQLVDMGHLTRREVPGKGCTYTVHPRRNCGGAETAGAQKLRDTPAEIAGKPSMNHKTSGAKAPSVSRGAGKRTFEQVYGTDKQRQAFGVLAVQWAMGELKWRPQDARAEYARFVDSNIANGRTYKDWLAAWRNWCRSEFCVTAKSYSADDATAYRREPIRG